MEITSSQNKLAKLASGLHDRKIREREKKFLAEGVRLCAEALDSPQPVDFLLYTAPFARSPEATVLLRRAGQKQVPLFQVSESVLKKASGLQTPPGVMGVVSQPQYSLETVLSAGSSCLVFADHIQDPGNLGALLRTVEALGGSALVTDKGSVDAFNPKVVRGSMGAVLRCPILQAGSLKEWVALARRRKLQVVMAHPRAQKILPEFSFGPVSTVVLGSEGQGLSLEDLKLADHVVKVPMPGRAESLNLAVAAGILLYERLRQSKKI